MSEVCISDEELLERLHRHPEIRGRLEALLFAVADEVGDLKSADAAEFRLIDEMRQMGHASLTAWAQQQVEKQSAEQLNHKPIWREGKKN